ncbi:MAG: PP2C family protein-serine/threonine phosphatase [Brevinematia bacterium]
MNLIFSKYLILSLFLGYSLVYFVLMAVFVDYSLLFFLLYFIGLFIVLMLYKRVFFVSKNILTDFVEIVFTKIYNFPNKREFFNVIKSIFGILGIKVETITVLFDFGNSSYDFLGSDFSDVKEVSLRREKVLLAGFIESFKVRLPFVDLKNTTLLPNDVFENSKEFMKMFSSNFLVPIYSPDFRLVGMIFFRAGRIRFKSLFYLSQLINIVSTMFKVMNESEKKKVIEEDMKIAFQIQSKLVPTDYMVNNWFECYGVYIPAYNIGGDYLDIIEKKNSFFFTIGDVSGKGVSAALVSTMVKTILNSTEISSKNISKVVKSVNNHIYRWFYDDENILTFLTLFIGNYVPSTRNFYYINAGHVPPILVKSSELVLLTPNSKPIGIFEKLNLKKQSVSISKNDIMVLYTDGLIEQIDARGREFGINLLKKILVRLRDSDSKKIVEELVKKLREFSQENINDDVCILVVKFK